MYTPTDQKVVIKKTKEGFKFCEITYITDNGKMQAVRTLNFKGFMETIMNEVYKVPIGERDKAMEKIYIKLAYIIDYIDPKWYAKHPIDPDLELPWLKKSFLAKKTKGKKRK